MSDNMSTFLFNLRRRLKWKGGLISIFTIGFLGFSLLYLMPRKNGTPGLLLNDPHRPVVSLRQGKVVGLELGVEAGYPQVLEAFRGVPYAQSTAGERRFMPPLPMNASDEIFDASLFRDKCPAGPPTFGSQSEDCLNANIYRTKERGGNQRLPVVIQFHGGAFNFGAGDSSRFLSHFVAWSKEPMIAVAFNYRVGAFGFLAGKVMHKAGLLNVGLRDQVMLMEWVKENIAAFGGDPDNVTVMGSSAGAHSIGHHLIYKPDTPPPFHRAILESGAATARAVYSYNNPLTERQFLDLLKKLNIATTPESSILPALRKVSTTDLKKASDAIFTKYNPSLRWPFQPVIDGPGGLIPIAPITALKSGKFHKLPLLTGFNTNEGAMFVPKSAETGKQFMNFFKDLLPGLRDLDIEKLSEVYPDPETDPESIYQETREGLGKQFKRLEQAYGQFAYIAPVRQTAKFFSEAKGGGLFGKIVGLPVYLYRFDASGSVVGGADHGSQVPWVSFMPERRDKGVVVEEIAGSMHAYWSSFVTSGDPNIVKGRWGERVKWPVYRTGDEAKVLVFGEGNDELTGGHHQGISVQVKDDMYAQVESGFWWARTELFEF